MQSNLLAENAKEMTSAFSPLCWFRGMTSAKLNKCVDSKSVKQEIV